MTMTQLSTNPRLGFKMWATSPTDSTAAPTVTLTEPTVGDGVIATKNRNTAILFYFGGDAADEVFDVILYGWSHTTGVNPTWIPHYMGRHIVTLGTTTGVASGEVLNTEFFADTIGIVYASQSHNINSNAQNGIASATVDLEGASYLQLQIVTNTEDSANAIVSLF